MYASYDYYSSWHYCAYFIFLVLFNKFDSFSLLLLKVQQGVSLRSESFLALLLWLQLFLIFNF